MTDVTIALPSALQNWVETRIATGSYADAGDYLRDLVRRDREAAATDRSWLKAMIAEGFASDVVDREPEQVLDAIIAEDPELSD